jgi:hypothetical protein
MLSCREAALLMSRRHDARLTWRERLGLRLHLLICEACSRAVRQLEFLRRAARGAGEGPLVGTGPTLPDSARQRIAARIARPR